MMLLTLVFGVSSPSSFYGGLAFLWIFSAAVSAMSKPQTSDGYLYQWLYRFSHLLAANLDKVAIAELNCQPTAAEIDSSTPTCSPK